MSPLAILIISIVLINTAGKVILACIDAKKCKEMQFKDERKNKQCKKD